VTTYPTRTRHWTRAEYDRLIEIGLLHDDEPIELLAGQLIVSEPKGSGHQTAIGLLEDVLRATLGPEWIVRSQGPIALDDVADASAAFGWRYAEKHVFGPDSSVSPLAIPAAHLIVSDLLP
jgi:Uma2 family endonuclease